MVAESNIEIEESPSKGIDLNHMFKSRALSLSELLVLSIMMEESSSSNICTSLC